MCERLCAAERCAAERESESESESETVLKVRLY